MSDRRRVPATFTPAGIYVPPPPDGVVTVPEVPGVIDTPDEHINGHTRLGEYLMVDVRIAKVVQPGSRLERVCQALAERGACGVIEHTLVVDLMEASPEDRALLLDPHNFFIDPDSHPHDCVEMGH